MKKKTYKAPQSTAIELKAESLMEASQFDATVNPPTEEVEADDALSRILNNPFLN